MTAAGRPSTHFASPGRADASVLSAQIQAAAGSPVLEGVLRSVGGLLAVLNEDRQIVAVNTALAGQLGIPGDATFGLRPGEALGCAHATDMAAGCGTGEFCASCGAAIAIVACLEGDAPQERTCALTVTRGGEERGLCLRVRATPLRVGPHRLVLLFLQDVTAEEWRGALERTFFHDLNNLITGICGMGELLQIAPPADREGIARRIESLTDLLAREVAIQRALAEGATGAYRLAPRPVALAAVVEELRNVFGNHAAARDRNLLLAGPVPDGEVVTDFALLMRVLTNMLLNAFEATGPGGGVRLGVESAGGRVVFTVWNRGAIPERVRPRVFQRHFSTKQGTGRGLGTFAMRLLGEHYLGGRVSFASGEREGTTFRLELPAVPAPGGARKN